MRQANARSAWAATRTSPTRNLDRGSGHGCPSRIASAVRVRRWTISFGSSSCRRERSSSQILRCSKRSSCRRAGCRPAKSAARSGGDAAVRENHAADAREVRGRRTETSSAACRAAADNVTSASCSATPRASRRVRSACRRRPAARSSAMPKRSVSADMYLKAPPCVASDGVVPL